MGSVIVHERMAFAQLSPNGTHMWHFMHPDQFSVYTFSVVVIPYLVFTGNHAEVTSVSHYAVGDPPRHHRLNIKVKNHTNKKLLYYLNVCQARP
jgi:hypothetical protein